VRLGIRRAKGGRSDDAGDNDAPTDGDAGPSPETDAP
jgi:hypothetical protein